MLSNHKILSVFCIIATTCVANASHAATTPFSQYGMIQNVQDYSGNPFYNSRSYGATYPKIVYDSGPALKPGDCERAVSSLVENACAARNNCRNTTLSDIRPEVMVALSKLPNYNYASSCAGYIDTIYENYTKTAKNTPIKTTTTTFPTGATTNTKPQSEYEKRAAELKALQNQTKTSIDAIVSTSFPNTFDDLSFEQKNDIKRTGYEPYKNAAVYVPLNIERDTTAYKSTSDALCEEIALVRTCIEKYDKDEKDAETAFNRSHDYENPDRQKILKTAIANAIMSACKCTDGTRFADSIRAIMGVQCPASQTDAEQTATDYINNVLLPKLGA